MNGFIDLGGGMGAKNAGEGMCPPVTDSALAWLESEDIARAIVDERLTLVWTNDAGARLLGSRRGAEQRNGVFSLTDAAAQDRLLDLLDALEGAPHSLCARCPGNHGWLIVRAWPLPADVGSRFGFSLVVADDGHRPNYRHLDAAFGLTPSEHRVLIDLLDGNDVESLAALHGVTTETTRSHIRKIYSKLSVRSREQLFARVQPFNQG